MLSPYIVIGALEGSTAVGWSDLSSIWTALTSQISATTIVGVVAGVLGGTVGLGFLWWGAKYATRKLMAALKRGKVSA